MSAIITVASGKGGVGKTITAVSLAVNLRMSNRSVALVDGDLEMPNVADWFEIDDGLTLHDVLADDADIADAMVRSAPGFAVLPGSDELSQFGETDPNQFAYVIDRIHREYDYVILDTGGGISYENSLPLQLADQTVLVTSPAPPAVVNTRRTKYLIDLLGGEIRGVIVTKASDSSNGNGIATDLKVELLGTVPYSETVVEATRDANPLDMFNSDNDVANAYREITEAVVRSSDQ